MKFTYLGTAAAEGWPGVFCQCEACLKAQRLGGKNIRTRSQAIINSDLLIDLPPDTYMHKLKGELDLSAVEHLFITHCHMDHFYPQELTIYGSCYSTVMTCQDLHVYGAQETYDMFRSHMWEADDETQQHLYWHILKPFETVRAGRYTVTPLPANHMGKGNEPFVYHIVDENGVSVFYLHDSGYYAPEVWEYFKAQKKSADLVSFDTTFGREDSHLKSTHFGFPDVLRVRDEMRSIGLVDEHTRCVINHFSHNGHLLHHELEALAAPESIDVSYDGKEIML